MCAVKTSLKLLCGELIEGWERGRDTVFVSQAGDNSSRDGTQLRRMCGQREMVKFEEYLGDRLNKTC